MTASTIQSLRDSLPQAALKRGEVVRIFKSCGLGGWRRFKRLKADGTLKPLRGLMGAKQARYGKEHILALCAEALS